MIVSCIRRTFRSKCYVVSIILLNFAQIAFFVSILSYLMESQKAYIVLAIVCQRANSSSLQEWVAHTFPLKDFGSVCGLINKS